MSYFRFAVFLAAGFRAAVFFAVFFTVFFAAFFAGFRAAVFLAAVFF